MCTGNLDPTGIRSPDSRACSKLLRQLSHPSSRGWDGAKWCAVREQRGYNLEKVCIFGETITELDHILPISIPWKNKYRHTPHELQVNAATVIINLVTRLQPGKSWVRIPAGAIHFSLIQTSKPSFRPTKSHTQRILTVISLLVKWLVCKADHSYPSSVVI
jgi:hypothetical protein